MFSSERISKVNSCELGTALSDISLIHNPHPCKYNSIKEASGSVRDWGSAAIVIHLLFCGSLLFKILYGVPDIFKIGILVVVSIQDSFTIILHLIYHQCIHLYNMYFFVDGYFGIHFLPWSDIPVRRYNEKRSGGKSFCKFV